MTELVVKFINLTTSQDLILAVEAKKSVIPAKAGIQSSLRGKFKFAMRESLSPAERGKFKSLKVEKFKKVQIPSFAKAIKKRGGIIFGGSTSEKLLLRLNLDNGGDNRKRGRIFFHYGTSIFIWK